MKPGDRIELLKSLSTRLCRLDWEEIDLTLRQFGFGWSEQWPDGDRKAYCLHHLESGSDASLSQLAEYLFGEQETSIGIDGDPWRDGAFRLFLSHVSEKKAEIAEIKASLSLFAIDGFLAHEDIEPTREWTAEIERALSSCDALAAFLVTRFHDSNWTDQEIGFCLRRRILIIPVRQGLDPYGFIQRYQALTPSSQVAEVIARELFDILVAHDLTSAKMAEALVRQLADSDSFAAAKANMALVEEIKVWTPELLRVLEDSPTKNSQVRDAWSVPESIRSVVSRHGK